MRVDVEHRLRVVAEPCGNDVHRDALGQRQRRCGVAQDVKRPGRDSGGLALPAEPLGQPLRMDRGAERVGEDEILVDVGSAREVSLEQLIRKAASMPADLTIFGGSMASRRKPPSRPRSLLFVGGGGGTNFAMSIRQTASLSSPGLNDLISMFRWATSAAGWGGRHFIVK